MTHTRSGSILLSLLAACGPNEGAPFALECGPVPEFGPCEGPDGIGVCAMGACVPVPACPGDGCGGPTDPLADTQLTFCVDGGDGQVACPGAAADPSCADTPYCGQDAQYGDDLAGGARFERDGDEPVVHDLVTGRTWAGCALGQTGPDCGGEALVTDFYEASAACEALEYGGYDDWVLPDAWSMQSIVDYAVTGPAFDLAAFPGTPSTFAEDYDAWWEECAWTSSTYAGADQVGWVVMTNSGDVSQGSGLTYHYNDHAADGWAGCAARCVRERAPSSTARFIRIEPVPQEPIVVDRIGPRVWAGCAVGQAGAACDGPATMLTWVDALAACEGLVWADQDDWRLPDVKELLSIVDHRFVSPAVDPALFPGTPYYGPVTTLNVGNFWSSTARDYNDFALYVDFGQGFSHFYVQSETRHVRCVRG
jgi:hypothetical protein